ncbi:MAG: polysaccharide deacetylase family protein, partial [Syntrophothermus sp.]
FDDLPAVAPSGDIQMQRNITEKLLSLLSENKISAVGFVNEGKLYEKNQPDKQKVKLLETWLKRGHELGNHTYSHYSLNETPLEKFTEDVIKGETVTRKLLSQKGMKLRYFRHPYLHTGRTPEVKKGFEEFLRNHNYTAAPVTIDNSDWIFAKAYSIAIEKGDSAMMKKIGAEYVPYLQRKFEYYEKESDIIFGRQIKQVLLLHANTINADYFGEVAGMLRSRGYKFISLADALKDSAYSSEDNYMKAGGISWLHRWAITRGLPREIFKGEPLTPEFIAQYAGVEAE